MSSYWNGVNDGSRGSYRDPSKCNDGDYQRGFERAQSDKKKVNESNPSYSFDSSQFAEAQAKAWAESERMRSNAIDANNARFWEADRRWKEAWNKMDTSTMSEEQRARIGPIYAREKKTFWFFDPAKNKIGYTCLIIVVAIILFFYF